MTNRSISALTRATYAGQDDILPIVQGGVTKKIARSDLLPGSVNLRAYGAAGDGVTDDTAAIQAAVSTGRAVYAPDGSYKHTSNISLPSNVYSQRIFGESMENTIFVPTGTGVKGFVSTAALVRVQMENFAITGASGTGHAIDLSSGTVYESSFKNLSLYAGGKAIYAPDEFSSNLENIQASSHADNGIEIEGGPCTTLVNCYGHNFATGKYAYRLYGGGVMVGCNGVDVGDYVVLAGRATSKGDSADTIYRLTVVGGNFEDFKKNAIQLRYNGRATIINPMFVPPAVATSATYDCSVYQEFSDQGVVLIGGTVSGKGASRNKGAELFADGGVAPISVQGFTTTWDNASTVGTIASVTTSQAAFQTHGLNVNHLIMGRGWGFYSPAATTWTADATSFSVTSIDRVKTANTQATNLSQATGGVDMQELTIHVRDANTTIKHNTGGAGRFMNSSGADIAATNGRPYRYVSDGSVWWQV